MGEPDRDRGARRHANHRAEQERKQAYPGRRHREVRKGKGRVRRHAKQRDHQHGLAEAMPDERFAHDRGARTLGDVRLDALLRDDSGDQVADQRAAREARERRRHAVADAEDPAAEDRLRVGRQQTDPRAEREEPDVDPKSFARMRLEPVARRSEIGEQPDAQERRHRGPRHAEHAREHQALPLGGVWARKHGLGHDRTPGAVFFGRIGGTLTAASRPRTSADNDPFTRAPRRRRRSR